MIITPMFSYWTFGPIKQDLQSTSKKKCCNNFVTKSQFIGISFWHTWINTILSIICTATGLYFTHGFMPEFLHFLPILIIGTIPIFIIQNFKCPNRWFRIGKKMSVLDINQMEKLTHLELIKDDHMDQEIEEGIEILNKCLKTDDKSKTKEDEKREYCQLKNLIPIQDLI